MNGLRARLRELYHGDTSRAIRFRTMLLGFDAVLILFFIVSPFIERSLHYYAADFVIGGLLAVDLTARAWAYSSLRGWILRPIVWVDLVVLASLMVPTAFVNMAFLRVLRAFTLVRSSSFWAIVGGGRWLDSHVQEVTQAVTNLLVFIFIMTGFVHSTFAASSPGIDSYLDSLYFTVASLTTTGYGDIVLEGRWGRILSITMMVVGISLFVRLAQVLLRPPKVLYPCPRCGLRRHDTDAVYCKACGGILAIPDDGDT